MILRREAPGMPGEPDSMDGGQYVRKVLYS